jgi:hypothetical protein
MGDSMSTIINATTTNGVVIQPDNSGSLVLQTNSGTTALTIDTSQNATFAAQATIPTINLTGGQITFPATQSASADANTLDDYEEGTWTPVVQGTSTAGAATYSERVGKYTKIGNTVNIMCSLSWTAHTGSGDTLIGGLPFTSATYSLNGIWASSIYANNMNFGTSATQLVGLITEGASTIIFRGMINNATRTTVPLDTSVDNLVMSFTYYV